MTALEEVAQQVEFADSKLKYSDFWRWFSCSVPVFKRLSDTEPVPQAQKIGAPVPNETLTQVFIEYQVFFVEFLAQRIETESINQCYMRVYSDLRKYDTVDGWCADPYLVKHDQHLARIRTARTTIRETFEPKGSGILAGRAYSQRSVQGKMVSVGV